MPVSSVDAPPPPWIATITFAALGLIVPASLLIVNGSRGGVWWPDWIAYVWPTSYMFIATSGIVNWYWYEIAAISIGLNALLYALVGALLAVAGRKLDAILR